MNYPSLNFKNPIIESEYHAFRFKTNIYPLKLLTIFNFAVQILICIFLLKDLQYTELIYPFFIIIFYILIIIVFKCFKNQELNIVFCILGPFLVGCYFQLKRIREYYKDRPFESFFYGFYFHIILSFIFTFKLSWYKMQLINAIGIVFVILATYLLENNRLIEETFFLIPILIFQICFEYSKEIKERIQFLNDYFYFQSTITFKDIMTHIIPDQILIWKNSLAFANEATFKTFNTSDLKNIEDQLLNDFDISINLFASQKEKEKLNFLKLIKQILINSECDHIEFNSCLGYMKFLNDSSQHEWDIKMKKIIWDNEEAVLIIMSEVTQKNIEQRSDYVNSFIDYILGNLSHEVFTPLHILQSTLESMNSDITTPTISPSIRKDFSAETKESISLEKKTKKKDMKIATDLVEVIINLIKTFIDLFQIRKGQIFLSVDKNCINSIINSVLDLFSELIEKKKVLCKLTNNIQFIYTDGMRFKQILIILMNISLKSMIEGTMDIEIKQETNSDMIDFSFSMKGKFQNDFQYTLMERYKNNYSGQKHEFDNTMTLFIIDYIISILSKGRCHAIRVEKEESSFIKYSFKIYNIFRKERIFLNDPFKKNSLLQVDYIINGSINDLDILEKNEQSDEIKSGINLIDFNEGMHNQSSENFSPRGILEINPIINHFGETHQIRLKTSGFSYERIKRFIMAPKFVNEVGVESKKNYDKAKQEKVFILNVDDNELNLNVIKLYCEKLGYKNVYNCLNGKDAFDKFVSVFYEEKYIFHLIFMDINMPIMDGLESSKKIANFCRENSINNPKVILITANSINSHLNISGIASAIVEKPMNYKKFKKIMREFT